MAVTDTTFHGIATILGLVSGDRIRPRDTHPGELVVAQSFLIDRPAEVLYAAWRDLAGLPGILTSLERVEVLDDIHSRWHVRTVGGSMTWDVVITEDEPNEKLAWATQSGAEIAHRGFVRFQPTPRGTDMRAELHLNAVEGKTRVEIARLLGRAPDARIQADLRAFKRRMEVGQAPTVKGQSRGSCGGRARADEP